MVNNYRCHTVPKRHHLFYMWGTMHFFDAQDDLETLVTVLLGYAFATRNAPLAVLLRSLCATGKRVFDEYIDNAAAPDMGDGGHAFPALFHTYNERLAWCFARCHLCLRRPAIHRCTDLVPLQTAAACSTLVCDSCIPKGSCLYLREPVRTMGKRGSLLLARHAQLGVQYALDTIGNCKITARHIGKHRWVGTCNGKVVRQDVLLTSVWFDRQDGSKSLHLHVPLRKKHHDVVFGRGAIRNSTVNNVRALFVHILLKGGGHTVVDKVIAWPKLGEATSTQSGRPKKSTSKPPLPLKCTHSYRKPFRGAHLRHCTFCEPCY